MSHPIGDAIISYYVTSLILFVVVAAVGGWALIEGLIFLFSHITIGWRG